MAVKLDSRLAVLKISWLLGYIFPNLFLFSPNFFKISHIRVMIYNTINQSNDTTERQKEKKICFNANAGGKRNLTLQCIVSKQSKQDGVIKKLSFVKVWE